MQTARLSSGTAIPRGFPKPSETGRISLRLLTARAEGEPERPSSSYRRNRKLYMYASWRCVDQDVSMKTGNPDAKIMADTLSAAVGGRSRQDSFCADLRF